MLACWQSRLQNVITSAVVFANNFSNSLVSFELFSLFHPPHSPFWIVPPQNQSNKKIKSYPIGKRNVPRKNIFCKLYARKLYLCSSTYPKSWNRGFWAWKSKMINRSNRISIYDECENFILNRNRVQRGEMWCTMVNTPK